jgi:hypothetical protein
MLPSSWNARENWCPFVSRTQGTCCSMNNRMHKPAGLVLLSQQQYHWTALPDGNQAPEFLLPTDLVLLSWQQRHCTMLPESWAGNLTPESLLSADLVFLSLQQLPWLWYWALASRPTVFRLGSLELPAMPLYCAPWNLDQQPGSRTPAAHKLGSHIPAAATVAPVAWCQQACLRVITACRLGSHVPAADAVVPGSPHPMQVDSRASTALWAPDNSSLLALLPSCYPQLAIQWQDPTTTHLREPHAPIIHSAGTRRLSSPQTTETSALPTVPDIKRALAPPSKGKSARFPTERKKAVTRYSADGTRNPVFPKLHRSPVFHNAPPCRRVSSLLSKELESQVHY